MNDPQAPSKVSASSLGLAGKTAKAFINSPLSLLLLLSFLAIGILGLMVTPRQEDPQISVPMIDIFVQYPGASSEEVDALIARPLEAIMSEITGVEHVYSASHRGQAMVTVQFKVGEQLEPSLVKLHDKLFSNRDAIPMGASEPLVKPKGVDDVPIVTVTLWSNSVDDASLRLVGLEVLQSLRTVQNTSQSFIVDGRREKLQVELMPERLASFGISVEQVANTIRMANAEQPTGYIESGGLVHTVYSGRFLTSAQDVMRLLLTVVEGRPVYVRDVANVLDGPSEAERMVGYYTGLGMTDVPEEAVNAPAVTLAIAKKHGTNGVDVSRAILRQLDSLKGSVIPDDVHVAITRDYGATAKAKVDELLQKLLIATIIVTILVWLALGWRAGFVVLVVIPVVITTTVFSAWVLGMTIDRVSLFALIFSIGILVDDAIVVVENIYRRWLLAGEQSMPTAIDAVREVGNPTILATFTVIAALLPMGFVSGMMGPYMMPIPVLGSIAMLISLFAAFAFTPWLTYKFKPSLAKLQADAVKEHKQAQRIDRFFRGLIIPLVQKPVLGYGVLVGIIAVFFAVMTLFYPFKAVPVKMLPLDNKPEFNIVINMPEGTSLPVTANLLHELALEMQKVPEVIALQSYSGTASPFNFNGLVRHYYLRQQPWQGDIQVQLLDKGERERTSHQIAVEARERLTPIAQAHNARIQVVEMPPGPPVLQTIVAEIYHPDAEVRRAFARDMMGFFEQAESLADVDSMLEADHEVLNFVIDVDKAQRHGISVEDVNRTLSMVMGGFILGDIKRHALIEPTRIVMHVPLNVRSQLARLAQLPVTNAHGRSMPLSELGSFEYTLQDKPIYRKDLVPVDFVTAEGVGRLAAPVYGQAQVEALLKAANDDQGYVTAEPDNTLITGGYWVRTPDHTKMEASFVWGGEWTVTYETFRDMGIAFAAALILIYMLIVAQFGNFTLPAIIMAPIPLTLIGIIPGHWIMGAEFTATSMIGFIALAGIIVRNSILLVDFARETVTHEDISVMEAVIRSCEARTRPIIITALALLGGSLVILADPIFQGMAVSLIFGGAVATLLTLVVIPLGCISAGNSLAIPSDPDEPTPPPSGGSNHGGNGGHGGTPKQGTAIDSPTRPHKQGIVKNVAVYLPMYVSSLFLSTLTGIRDSYYAGVGVLRKKAKPPAKSATLSTGKVDKQSKPTTPPKPPEAAPEVVKTLTEEVPAQEKASEQKVQQDASNETSIVNKPETVSVKPQDQALEVDTAQQQPTKPPAKRRGIKLKKGL